MSDWRNLAHTVEFICSSSPRKLSNLCAAVQALHIQGPQAARSSNAASVAKTRAYVKLEQPPTILVSLSNQHGESALLKQARTQTYTHTQHTRTHTYTDLDSRVPREGANQGKVNSRFMISRQAGRPATETKGQKHLASLKMAQVHGADQAVLPTLIHKPKKEARPKLGPPRKKQKREPGFTVSAGNNPEQNPPNLVDKEDREGDQPEDEEAIPQWGQEKEHQQAADERHAKESRRESPSRNEPRAGNRTTGQRCRRAKQLRNKYGKLQPLPAR